MKSIFAIVEPKTKHSLIVDYQSKPWDRKHGNGFNFNPMYDWNLALNNDVSCLLMEPGRQQPVIFFARPLLWYPLKASLTTTYTASYGMKWMVWIKSFIKKYHEITCDVLSQWPSKDNRSQVGLYSLSNTTSCQQIPRNLEAARNETDIATAASRHACQILMLLF